MFIPFLSSHAEIKQDSDKITIRANFGMSFKSVIRKLLSNEKKINALFLSFKLTELTFYKFFKNEVKVILEEVINYKYPRGLNIKILNECIDLLNNLDKAQENFSLDYKAVENRFKFKILPHQEAIFNQYEYFKRNYHYRGMLIDADPGTGKAQPLTAKILTPSGWRTMGEIQPGDLVLNPSLEPVKVLQIFPQGVKDIYRVTFEDGRSTECCKEHLWEIYTTEKIGVKTLEEIMKEDYSQYSIKRIINRFSSDYEEPGMEKLKKIMGSSYQAELQVTSKNDSDRITYLVRKYGGSCSSIRMNYGYNLKIDFTSDLLKIKQIEYVGEKEAKCILIDDPDHLYVTDDYIVTHNTFSSLALSTALKSNLTIIICPNPTLKEVWIDSISSDSGKCVFSKPQKVYVVKDGQAYNNEEFILCHYEGLEKLKDLLYSINNLNEVCYIIDESHNLAAKTSKRTTLALECLEYIATRSIIQPNVLLLSGTPLKSEFTELLNISSFIDPYLTDQAAKNFLDLYRSPNKLLSELLTQRYKGYSVKVKKDSIKLEPVITEFVKVRLTNGNQYTLTQIRKELREYIEKRLGEIRSQLPYYKETYIQLKNTALTRLNKKPSDSDVIKYEREFEAVSKASPKDLAFMGDMMKRVNDFEALLTSALLGGEKKSFTDAKSIMKYPELKVQGEALGIIITGKRIQCHMEMAKELNFKEFIDSTTKKTVIFSNYIKVCQAAYDNCRSAKYNPIGVFGESVKNLDSSVKAFMTDKITNPIIATYKALSTGVPLIAGNVVVCLDLPFRMFVYDQAISRVWRLGQDKQVYIYILSLDTGEEPNINSRNIDIITFFKEEVEKITGYKANLELDRSLNTSMESLGYGMESLDYDPNDVLYLKDTSDSDKGIFKLWS